MIPLLSDITKIQSQFWTAFSLKMLRMREQLWLNIDPESTQDLDKGFFEIFRKCEDYTLTPLETMYAMYEAVKYISQAQIGGDLVECGVWKGGSCMIAALTLLQLSDTARTLYLYDTYAGMPAPGSRDGELGMGATKLGMDLLVSMMGMQYGDFFYASLTEVKENMHSTRYPPAQLRFVKGMVEDTIPGTMPAQIALLRLDSDLFQSTYHELTHLFPKLSTGGVLIIDDYGSWKGNKSATDQYFKEQGITMLLKRIGPYGARMGIKQ